MCSCFSKSQWQMPASRFWYISLRKPGTYLDNQGLILTTRDLSQRLSPCASLSEDEAYPFSPLSCNKSNTAKFYKKMSSCTPGRTQMLKIPFPGIQQSVIVTSLQHFSQHQAHSLLYSTNNCFCLWQLAAAFQIYMALEGILPSWTITQAAEKHWQQQPDCVDHSCCLLFTFTDTASD
jgi:hypothetical protein